MLALLFCAAVALPQDDDCIPTTNSTGLPGRLEQTGLDSFAVSQVPVNSFTGLMGGSVAVNWPFADGRLCVNPALNWWRLPGAELASDGSANFNAGTFLIPGQVTHVQSWYRDNDSPGFGFNLTNRVTWEVEE